MKIEGLYGEFSPTVARAQRAAKQAEPPQRKRIDGVGLQSLNDRADGIQLTLPVGNWFRELYAASLNAPFVCKRGLPRRPHALTVMPQRESLS